MIFTFLFTPYGYKFEGKVESGWRAGMINEDYGNTDVNRPTNKPWNHAKIGAINPENQLSALGSQGYYWGNTGYMTSGQAHGFYFDNRNLFPANYSGRQSGLSVCRVEIINLLFTPYGYKFATIETGGAIRENYRGTGVRWITENPWKLSMAGWVDIRQSNIVTSLSNYGVYWESTSEDNMIGGYHAWMHTWGLYPGITNARLHGFSVGQ